MYLYNKYYLYLPSSYFVTDAPTLFQLGFPQKCFFKFSPYRYTNLDSSHEMIIFVISLVCTFTKSGQGALLCSLDSGPLLPPFPTLSGGGGRPCRHPSLLSSRHCRFSVRGCSSLEACHEACPGMVNVLPRKGVSSTSRTYTSLGLAQHRWQKWPQPLLDDLSTEDEKSCGLLMSGCWSWRTFRPRAQDRLRSRDPVLLQPAGWQQPEGVTVLLPSSATPLVRLSL